MSNQENEPYLRDYHNLKYKKKKPYQLCVLLNDDERAHVEKLARLYTRGNKTGLIQLMIKSWKPASLEVVIPGIKKE